MRRCLAEVVQPQVDAVELARAGVEPGASFVRHEAALLERLDAVATLADFDQPVPKKTVPA